MRQLFEDAAAILCAASRAAGTNPHSVRVHFVADAIFLAELVRHDFTSNPPDAGRIQKSAERILSVSNDPKMIFVEYALADIPIHSAAKRLAEYFLKGGKMPKEKVIEANIRRLSTRPATKDGAATAAKKVAGLIGRRRVPLETKSGRRYKIAVALRRKREKLGLTVVDASQKAGVSFATWYALERANSTRVIRDETLIKIARIFDPKVTRADWFESVAFGQIDGARKREDAKRKKQKGG